jgi:AcrR family transcriptional regulator
MAKRKAVTARKQPVQERSKATVDALVKATAYILIRHGYERTTTNRIAERAGVNIASLYQFFPNKEALVAEVDRRHATDARSAVTEALRAHCGDGPKARLQALVAAVIAAHVVSPSLHRVLAEVARHTSDGVSAIDDGLRAELDRLTESFGIRADDSLVRWVAFETLHALVHRAAAERPEALSSGALERELLPLLWRYLEKR